MNTRSFKFSKEVEAFIEDIVTGDKPYTLCNSKRESVQFLINYFSDDDRETIQEEYIKFTNEEIQKGKNYIISLETYVKRVYGDRIFKYKKIFMVDYNNNYSENIFIKLCEISGATNAEKLFDFCNDFYEK